MTKEKTDYASEIVAILGDLISQEEFRNQISADISEKLQKGLKSYLEELKLSNAAIGREILQQLQTIERKDLKELRADDDLKDPSVGIISDTILVKDEYLAKKAEEVIARANTKRPVFVVGEPGVGKSKLLYLIWKKLKEKDEETAYLLNLRETPLYHGVLFYDDFKADFFDPLTFSALTTKQLVVTIRDIEHAKLKSNPKFKELQDRGAIVPIYLRKEELERVFFVRLAEAYLGDHALTTRQEVIDELVTKSEGLPIYITTVIEHCASTDIKIEDFVETVPPGIFNLIGMILLETFYKETAVEIWALSTLAGLAHWQGLMHEAHLKALKDAVKRGLHKSDDLVRFYDVSQYKYLLKKVDSYYLFKHWTWVIVLSAVNEGNLDTFEDSDLRENLGNLHRDYLSESGIDFDELLKSSYFLALEKTKDEREKLDLFKSYLLIHSRYLFDLEMYAEVVGRLEFFYEIDKPPEIAAELAKGLYNLITAFGTQGEFEKAVAREAKLETLYSDQKTPEIAAELAKGLYNLILLFKLRNDLDKCLIYCDELSELSMQHDSLEITEIYTKALKLI